MPDDSDVVAVLTPSTSVVVTPQDQIVTSVMQEVSVATVETKTTVCTEVREFHVVAVSPPAGDGRTKGAVFILDVTPTSTGIVSGREYEPDTVPAFTVLTSCTSDTTAVRVWVGGEGAGDDYSPVITVNGVEAVLTESSTKRWFTGYADLVLSGAGEHTISAVSSAGGKDTFTIEVVGAGPAVLSVVFGPYPGSQTELKAGDIMTATVTTEPDATSLTLMGGGASDATIVFPVTGGVANVSFTIGSASDQVPIHLKAKNTFGTFGNDFTSSNLTLNQTHPSFGAISVVYPATKGALDIGDQATVSCAVTNFDTILYSSSAVTITDVNTYELSKVATQFTTGYVGSGMNYTITATRAANNATASASTVVRIATVPPTAAITIVPSGRLTSSPTGLNYNVRITPDQIVSDAPTLTASHGTWSGSWANMGSYWQRTLVVSDGVPRGTGVFSSLSLTGLSNLVGTVITSGSTYTVGGFSQRNVTYPPFSRVAPLGVAVADQTKTSAQVAGGAVLTRYTDTVVRANGYYIADSDGSYNPNGTYIGLSDSLFAGSNTSGTLQVIVQEVA